MTVKVHRFFGIGQGRCHGRPVRVFYLAFSSTPISIFYHLFFIREDSINHPFPHWRMLEYLLWSHPQLLSRAERECSIAKHNWWEMKSECVAFLTRERHILTWLTTSVLLMSWMGFSVCSERFSVNRSSISWWYSNRDRRPAGNTCESVWVFEDPSAFH